MEQNSNPNPAIQRPLGNRVLHPPSREAPTPEPINNLNTNSSGNSMGAGNNVGAGANNENSNDKPFKKNVILM